MIGRCATRRCTAVRFAGLTSRAPLRSRASAGTSSAARAKAPVSPAARILAVAFMIRLRSRAASFPMATRLPLFRAPSSRACERGPSIAAASAAAARRRIMGGRPYLGGRSGLPRRLAGGRELSLRLGFLGADLLDARLRERAMHRRLDHGSEDEERQSDRHDPKDALHAAASTGCRPQAGAIVLAAQCTKPRGPGPRGFVHCAAKT